MRHDGLVASYTSLELSGGRVQRGSDPLWQGSGGSPTSSGRVGKEQLVLRPSQSALVLLGDAHKDKSINIWFITT